MVGMRMSYKNAVERVDIQIFDIVYYRLSYADLSGIDEYSLIAAL